MPAKPDPSAPSPTPPPQAGEGGSRSRRGPDRESGKNAHPAPEGGASPAEGDAPALEGTASHGIHGERYPRDVRIRRGVEILEMHRKGRRYRRQMLDLLLRPPLPPAEADPPAGPRLGIVVPRHRKSAVTRNRLKRRLREIGRRDLLPGLRACGSDARVLVRARPEAYDATHAELRETLVRFTEELCSGALSLD